MKHLKDSNGTVTIPIERFKELEYMEHVNMSMKEGSAVVFNSQWFGNRTTIRVVPKDEALDIIQNKIDLMETKLIALQISDDKIYSIERSMWYKLIKLLVPCLRVKR